MFQLEQVSKVYQTADDTIAALRPATLTIAAGEFLAVVGPSGSGKTTLLSLLGGMLTPSAGKVWFDGQSLYDLSAGRRADVRRLKMGFVFQTFNLVSYLTAQENVQVPLLLRGATRREQRERASELLAQVGLADRAGHKPSELSTGQQQRVALARTLANDPAVIFADEPTGNLDLQTRDSVLSFLDELHRAGRTIILVTHDPQVARRATRTMYMAAGGIDTDGMAGLRASA